MDSKNHLEFTYDWFSQNVHAWPEQLSSFKGRPDVQYLEIGTFEGRSLLWMFENILTNPSSQATCIDLFVHESKATLLKNIFSMGTEERVQVLEGTSRQHLRSLHLNFFDIIFIDGSHEFPNVAFDLFLAWDLLKTGGIFIIDDYEIHRSYPIDPDVKLATDFFISSLKDECSIILKNYQVFLQKK